MNETILCRSTGISRELVTQLWVGGEDEMLLQVNLDPPSLHVFYLYSWLLKNDWEIDFSISLRSLDSHVPGLTFNIFTSFVELLFRPDFRYFLPVGL